MGFFDRLKSIFSGGGARPASDRRYVPIYVVSTRCREPLAGQVDLMNELSQNEGDGPPYYARKVLQGSGRNRCFDQVEVQLWFDANKQVAAHEVGGGRWLSADEYQQALAEQAAREAAEAAAKEAAREAAQQTKNETGE